jgi:hypothetical protein
MQQDHSMKFESKKLVLLSSIIMAPFTAHAEGTKITIGGDIKLDGYYDTATNSSVGPRGYDLLSYRSIALDGTPNAEKAGGTKFHARASKFYIQSATPYNGGMIKTHLEGDFLGRVDGGEGTDDDTLSNSYEFRIRQAYVTWGNWKAGQAWSNFVDLKAYPEGITYSSTLGRAFVRQALISYTQPLGEGDRFTFSLENPDTDHNYGTPKPGSNAAEDDTLPDMIGTYFNTTDSGHFRASLLIRSLGVDTTVTEGVADARSDSSMAWGIGLSGKVNFSKQFNVKWNLNGGDGIGRYLYNNQFRSAAFVDNTLNTEMAWGGAVMLQYKPSNKVRMNIGYGAHTVDVDNDYIASSVTESLSSIHFNTFWTIAPSLEVGAGVTYGDRTIKDGQSGDITRFMFSVKKKFKASF